MSTPVWPAELPPAPMLDGTTYDVVSNAMPIPVEAGELLTRRRFTGEMATINVSLVLTKSQVQRLLSFYRDDCKESLPFLWQDPITEETVEMVFTSAPQVQPLGGDAFSASFTVSTKPAEPGGSPP